MSSFVVPIGAGSPPTTLNRLASFPISAHRAVTAPGDAGCGYADLSQAQDAHFLVGISTNAAAVGQPVGIQTSSELVEPSWSWTPGLPVFVDWEGQLTQTPPDLSSGAAWQRQLATALSPTRVLLVARPPVFLA